MRYGEKLQVDYDVAPEVGGYKILKLVLQPLVENAITHGSTVSWRRAVSQCG